MDNDDLLVLLARCESAVDELQRTYEWDLLERETFVARTMAVVQAGIMAVPDRAAWYVYSAVTYAACSGQEGKARQEKAYSEVYRCLYRRILYRYPDVEPGDAAQQSLLLIHERFARCRQPHAFFAFVFQRLWSEVRRTRRRRNYELPPLSNETLFPEPRAPEPEPAEEFLRRDQLNGWERFFQEAKRLLPRAAQQLEIVRLTYVVGLRDREIAKAMDISVTSIPPRRSRGLSKIREHPALRALGQKLGLF